MRDERWREVPGHPDYEVSDLGRVRSWKNNRWGRATEPRIMSLNQRRGGRSKTGPREYVGVTVAVGDGKYVQLQLHCLVLEVFVGPRPTPAHQGAHRNGRACDNRLVNLYWATPEENGADNARLGVSKGELHSQAKLTEDVVREIRASPLSQAQAARQFDTSQSNICRIRQRKAWSHVA